MAPGGMTAGDGKTASSVCWAPFVFPVPVQQALKWRGDGKFATIRS